MTRKILLKLSFLFIFSISLSCSKNEDHKKLSSAEITNYLLVNEQLPIKILSNALEVPENVIIGINLDLIKLNENGEEKLNDIFEEYLEDGKDDFIGDNSQQEWTNFAKSDWIKREISRISNSQLNKIQIQEFKNNKIAQANINASFEKYLDTQFNQLLKREFGFFSLRFWKSLGQLSIMHFKSIPGKFSNLSISYLKSEFENELSNKWSFIINNSFQFKELKEQPNISLKKYNSLINMRHVYICNIYKINKFEKSNLLLNTKIDKVTIQPSITNIISKLNLELIDNFSSIFFDLLICYISLSILSYLLKGLQENLIKTLIQTVFSPANFVLFSVKSTLIGLVSNYNEYKEKENELKRTKKIINRIIGFLFFVFCFIYFPKKHYQIENEIKKNIMTPIKKIDHNESINVIENLNLNTELFFLKFN